MYSLNLFHESSKERSHAQGYCDSNQKSKQVEANIKRKEGDREMRRKQIPDTFLCNIELYFVRMRINNLLLSAYRRWHSRYQFCGLTKQCNCLHTLQVYLAKREQGTTFTFSSALVPNTQVFTQS
jgi:hypothetical protein